MAPPARAETCVPDPILGRFICHASGGEDPVPPVPPADPDPVRYVYTTTDPGVGECFYWSRIPGGLDSWDPANDAAIIFIVTRLPPCPGGEPAPGTDGRAWEVFRSFPLTPPSIGLQPAGHGVTGLPTYLTVPEPDAIVHVETLPDGRILEVRAQVIELRVDWGDGTIEIVEVADALPFPDGEVTHTYATKTCSADYRVTHPAGGLCHPSLDAYPITATFTWAGAYRTGGPWISLGTLGLAATVSYDVDEVVGILRP